MLVSYNWLKQYVNLSKQLTPQELALKLTMSTVEVEGFLNQAESLDGVVVGEMLKIKKHPNADKLKLCVVSDGEEEYKIVCGGSNLKKGMKVAFGKIGAKVRWHGAGDLVEIKKAKIRGEISEGMICQSTEIGLGGMFPISDEAEILDLSGFDYILGTPLAQSLGIDDTLIDIDNKSITHRPDLWGHYGLAREVAALYKEKLGEYSPPEIKEGKEYKLKVDVRDHDLCPRYMGVVIDGVKVGASPEWLQKRLMAVGLKTINNIVDITNFILYDLGQPMHAFDANHLYSKKDNKKTIIVRRARKDEKFITLDEKEHELTEEMLVIADEKKVVALAGVMGGENSEISEETKTIVFEAANFDATSVRRTATALGIRTDASVRFEKSLDPSHAELALRRTVQLTLEICPEARVVSNVVDESKYRLDTGPIELSLDFLQKKIGMEIKKEQVIDILKSLDFEVQVKKNTLIVMVPTWRATKDISIPEDLVEEVARIYGYDNIEVSLPVFSVAPPDKNELRILERKLKQHLVLEFGFTESYNYSFVSPKLLQSIGIDAEGHVELDNPIAKDRPFLRRSLLPNLLENAEKNLHIFDEVRLFEIGKAFQAEEAGERAEKNDNQLLPRQNLRLGLVFAAKGDQTPYHRVASSLRGALESLGFSGRVERTDKVEYLHPGRQAYVLIGDQVLGMVGELHPSVQKNLGIDVRVAMAELNISELSKFYKEKSNYRSVPQYPPVMRDVAFVVAKEIEHLQVVECIKKVDRLIIGAELFDVFENSKLGLGKKSMACHIVYRSGDKTLESEDVDKIHTKVKKTLEKRFGAEIRT